MIEVLAVCLRTSPGITGVQLPNSFEQFKCSGYADDTTVAATSDESIEETFTIYGKFEQASGAGLGGPCPFKARPWLLTLLLSPRSGTFATSSPSLDGRRKESLKPFGPSSGLGRRILFGVVRSACQDRRVVLG